MNQIDQWLTLEEASNITGKSANAIRLLIKRGQIDQSKKVKGKGRGYWLIHKNSIGQITTPDQLEKMTNSDQSPDQSSNWSEVINQTNQTVKTLLEHFEQQRKEWNQDRDRLNQGLMMYRYKYEDLDKKVKLLPAPVETLPGELEKLRQQNEALQAELSRARQPWWKRLLGK